MEETTTGVIRLRAMAQDGALKIPVVAVNDAQTKHLFDNRYGTGQSTLDGIIRATGVLIAGSVVVSRVTAGAAKVSRRARAVWRGSNRHRSRSDSRAGSRDGRIPRDADGRSGEYRRYFRQRDRRHPVLDVRSFQSDEDGAFLANSGHFDVEIDIAYLNDAAEKVDRNITRNIDAYHLANGRTVYVLGQGRLVNLACAEGHPAKSWNELRDPGDGVALGGDQPAATGARA